MTIESEEGAAFVDVFKQTFGTRERVDRRVKAERHAGKTREQRARAGAPKVQKNFRATTETAAQLKALKAHTGKSETDIIALAIDKLAKQLLKGAKV